MCRIRLYFSSGEIDHKVNCINLILVDESSISMQMMIVLHTEREGNVHTMGFRVRVEDDNSLLISIRIRLSEDDRTYDMQYNLCR